MTMATQLSEDTINNWATNPTGPVALHLKQHLLPIEGPGGVIFPPTYAEIEYNIDTLTDGSKVATIDSVGSQANRLEPIFRAARPGQPENRFASLVPQVTIELGNGRTVSLLDAGHRLGDAIVRASTLRELARAAFEAFLGGDASAVAKLNPTALVFGAWDSRDTSAKMPRIVQATIRAWDVDKLTRSAQYSTPADYSALDVFSEEEKAKSEGNPKSLLAQRGFVHVPSVKAPGGIHVSGKIVRDVTINLLALRRLEAGNTDPSSLRRYILSLALVAATEGGDLFLRQGCLLTLDPEAPGLWQLVQRNGTRSPVDLASNTVNEYATRAASAFGVGQNHTVKFERELAKADLTEGGKKKEKGKEKAKEKAR